MRFISFEIIGNQQDRSGNPIPYLRTTQNSQWSDIAKRYAAWKSYVCMALIDQYPEYQTRVALQKKPLVIEKNQTAEVTLYVDLKNQAGGDLDNILKGINDALFENDKYITEIHCWSKNVDNGQGKVLVEVRINN